MGFPSLPYIRNGPRHAPHEKSNGVVTAYQVPSYSGLRRFELTVTPRDKRLSLACPSAVYANEFPIRLIERNHALNISGRVQDANFAGTEPRASLRIADRVVFRREHRLDAGSLERSPAPFA